MSFINDRDDHRLDTYAALLDRVGDLSHAEHPDETTLDRYLHGVLKIEIDTDISTGEQLSALLSGELGWTPSAISLHTISCTRCTHRLGRLRLALLADEVQARESSLRILAKSVMFGLKQLKRPAVAFALLLVVTISSLYLLNGIPAPEIPSNPPSADVVNYPESGGMGG